MGIKWVANFHRIAWAREKRRLVVSIISEDEDGAISLARHINKWNDRFVKLIIIEGDDEYAVCCYQDPMASRDQSIGLYRPRLPRTVGYEQAKIFFKERPPLFQVAYASDYTRMETYRQVSRLVSPARSRIISVSDLKRQEYYYERGAVAEHK